MTKTTAMMTTATQTSLKGFQSALITTIGKLFWLTLSKLIDYKSSQKNVFGQTNNKMTNIKSHHHTELLSKV